MNVSISSIMKTIKKPLVLLSFCLRVLTISHHKHQTIIIPDVFEKKIHTSSVFDPRLKQNMMIRKSTRRAQISRIAETIVFAA